MAPAGVQSAAAGSCSLIAQLSGDRIASELGGHELTGFSVVTDARWTERLFPDGITEFRNARGEPTYGRWRVSGDQLCFSYGTMTDWTCKTVHRVAPACEIFSLALVDESGRIASGIFSATPLGYGRSRQARQSSDDALEAAIARERSWGQSVRIGVQNALIWTGDYAGVLDGEFGLQTREAIRSFQRRIGSAVTGYLTEDEIARLEANRVTAVATTGFRVVEDRETGIRIGLPEAIFSRVGQDGIFIEYEPRPGHAQGHLLLLSSLGDASDLRALYTFLLSDGNFGPEPYAVLKEDWFVASGTQDGVTAYVHARAEDGTIKGFLLSWPESVSYTFGAIAAAMYNSFETIPGVVLRPDAVATYPEADESQQPPYASLEKSVGVDQATPGATLEPDLDAVSTGTGFVVHRSGKILTNAHVVEGCSEIAVAEGFRASVTALDSEVDLALLQTDSGEWTSVASFAARPARLNSDVTVMGFPLHGLLGGLNVTRGSVSAISGLRNDGDMFQITAAVQPGNSGGPVLDDQGSVVGVVQSKLNAVKVAAVIGDIPQSVNFAIRGELAKLFLAQHNVEFMIAGPRVPLGPADLAAGAQAYTTLITCLD